MCGILGAVFAGPDVERRLGRAMSLLHHRGPDGSGTWTDSVALFGHTRLRILDTSEAGDQPMVASDNRAVLVYNGEVYNYRALKSALGERFRPASHSDTDVVLELLTREGPDALPRMNGMWALALWRPREKKLLLARDRFGVKPLYYAELAGGGVAFASEIPALLALTGVTPEPDAQTLRSFLLYEQAEPRERTFYAGIRKLPAGCWAEVTRDGLRVRSYFSLVEAAASEPAPADPAAAWRDLFRDAVELRLRSDVPVGTCLSGGLDSSAIVCTAHRIARSGRAERTLTYHAFSARHPGTSADEGPFIDEVLQQTGFTGHDVVPQASRLMDDLEKLTWHQGEPFGSLSIYSQFCVMRLAREAGVTVLLDGQGSDEVLAGYPFYAHYRLADLVRRGNVAAALHLARGLRDIQSTSTAPIVRAVLMGLAPEVVRRQLRSRMKPEISRFLVGELASGPPDRLPFAYPDRFTDALYQSVVEHGLPSLLRYEDRNSMAFSLEARVPFLDWRLVTLGFRLPPELKLHDGWTKWVLREAMADDLPVKIRWRRDKKAFSTPQAEWLRGPMREWVRAMLASHELRERGFVDTAALTDAYEAWIAGGPSISSDLWRILSVELWLRALPRLRAVDEPAVTAQAASNRR
jgi:asparagine synthase (glutamine-hydrolysing)